MSNPGFIYILANPSLIGLLKIGKTGREPELRALELSEPTGVPSRFVLIHQVQVLDCDSAEKAVHAELAQFRESEDREFFRIGVKQAILSVDRICSTFSCHAPLSDFPDKLGTSLTPLMRASLSNDSEAVRILLLNGADPNEQSADGATALIMAAARGHAVVVDFLLVGGADMNISMHDGTSPLLAAQMRRRTYVAQMLLSYAGRIGAERHPIDRGLLHQDDKSQQFTQACDSNDIQGARFLLADDCDPNQFDKDGLTPLMLAARRGHMEMVSLLLQYAANPKATNSRGETADQIAELHGYFAVANLILRHSLGTAPG